MLIKERPEDFIVNEVIELDSSGGDYAYLKVTKRNWNTADLVSELAKRLGVRRRDIGFAGSKDRKAVTTQYVSVRELDKRRLEDVKIKDAILEFVGYGSKPISLGDLRGNKFRIKLDRKIDIVIEFIVNYFGEQRFGRNNVDVGRAILKKNFEEACRLIGLEVSGRDYIGALRRLDEKIVKLYLHSYQSHLWNECVRRYLRGKYKTIEHNGYVFTLRKEENVLIPLLNFDSELAGDAGEIYSKLMEEEKINLGDFVIREMPELVESGVSRDLFADVSEFRTGGEWVSFFLPAGSYATVVIDEIEAFLEG